MLAKGPVVIKYISPAIRKATAEYHVTGGQHILKT